MLRDDSFDARSLLPPNNREKGQDKAVSESKGAEKGDDFSVYKGTTMSHFRVPPAFPPSEDNEFDNKGKKDSLTSNGSNAGVSETKRGEKGNKPRGKNGATASVTATDAVIPSEDKYRKTKANFLKVSSLLKDVAKRIVIDIFIYSWNKFNHLCDNCKSRHVFGEHTTNCCLVKCLESSRLETTPLLKMNLLKSINRKMNFDALNESGIDVAVNLTLAYWEYVDQLGMTDNILTYNVIENLKKLLTYLKSYRNDFEGHKDFLTDSNYNSVFVAGNNTGKMCGGRGKHMKGKDYCANLLKGT